MLAAAAVFVAGALIMFNTIINHDAAHFLFAAITLNDGGTLYRDYLDYSFPMATWLAQASVALSNLTGMANDRGFYTVILVLQAASIAVSLAAARSLVAGLPFTAWVLPPLLTACVVLTPGYETGQRDIMFATLLAPLFTLQLPAPHRRKPSGAVRAASLTLAFIGSALKPTSALTLLALGACDLRRARGNLRAVSPDLVILAGSLGLYAAFCEVHYRYFSVVLHRVSVAYAPLQTGYADVIRRAADPEHLIKLAALVAIAAPLVRRLPVAVLTQTLAVFAALAGTALLQREANIYHIWPSYFVTDMALGLAAAATLDRITPLFLPTLAWRRAALSMAIGLALFLPSLTRAAAMLRSSSVSRAGALADPATRLMAALPPGARVVSLGSAVPPIAQLASLTHAGPGASFSELGAVFAIIEDANHAQTAGRVRNPVLVAIEADYRSRVLAALVNAGTALVFIDMTQPARWFETYPACFSLAGWLSADPRFGPALHSYTYMGTIQSRGHFTLQVWRRSAKPASV